MSAVSMGNAAKLNASGDSLSGDYKITGILFNGSEAAGSAKVQLKDDDGDVFFEWLEPASGGTGGVFAPFPCLPVSGINVSALTGSNAYLFVYWK